jgi:hypothetical protein
MTGYESSDLKSVAHDSFMKACESWDKERPYGTWVFRCVTNALIDHVRKFDRPPADETAITDLLEISDKGQLHPSVRMIFLEELNGLSCEALFVVGLALSGELSRLVTDKVEERITPKSARGIIKTFLVKHLGWKTVKVWLVFGELRDFLRRIQDEKRKAYYKCCY